MGRTTVIMRSLPGRSTPPKSSCGFWPCPWASLGDFLCSNADSAAQNIRKPFTYAEETGPDDGHYADFLKTLDFLAASDAGVDSVRTDLDQLRQATLAGEPTVDVRDRVQSD